MKRTASARTRNALRTRRERVIVKAEDVTVQRKLAAYPKGTPLVKCTAL